MKVTKGHFNRKVLFFGLLLFLAISLISTGFASWIMSTGTEEGADGNIHVGTITDGSLEFTDIVFVGEVNEIIFDAHKDDKDGSIKADLSEDAKYENLSITFTTTLNPVEYVKDLSISIALPSSVNDAVVAGYITIPSCCYVENTSVVSVDLIKNGEKQDLEGTGISATITDNEGTYNISITVTFGWGSQFGGKNPGYYLDEQTMDYPAKLAKMVEFKRSIYGLTTETTDEEVLDYTTPLQFDILLTAVAN